MSIELVMPFNQLMLCCPHLLLLPIFPSIRVFSNESVLRIGWPKYWSFRFSIDPFNIQDWFFFPQSNCDKVMANNSMTQQPQYWACESCLVVSDSLQPHGLYSPWNSPSQNTGVGSLLQEVSPTQGLNLGLLHCRQILYQLSHQESPRIQKWVSYPFSWGSYQPRNRTGVSCIADGFFTNRVIREAPDIGHIP